MKKSVCSLLIVISTISFIGCGGVSVEKSPENNTGISSTEDKNTDTSDNNGSDNIDNDATVKDDNPNSTNKDNPSEQVDTTERTFKISTKDITGSSDKIIYGADIVTIGLGVAENLRLILGSVSSDFFDGNTIELTTIETIDDKKIAVVNLTGNENYWYGKFNGSAGASVTEYTLIENVLQRDYPGYWINGVKFTLNGSAIVDTGHIPGLSTTSYR